MLKTRVIPTLLFKNSGLVKGQKFRNHKYVGDPINAVKIFNEKEVDEMVFLDISATIEKREPNFELLKDISSQAFMPFGYGGGITRLDQIEKLFKIGIEKVIINSAAFNNINLLKEASSVAGAQSIVASIDVKKNLFGNYKVFVNSGQVDTKVDPVEYALRVQDAGVGEIILCSIDREGTNTGFDYDLVKRVAGNLSIPLVASGGAGSLQDFKKVVDCGADAVAVGDMFVFYGKHKAVLITYPEYKILQNLF